MLKSLIRWVSSLLATVGVGALVTSLVVWLAFQSYAKRTSTHYQAEFNPLDQLIERVNQMAFDIRLRLRGARPGSSDLALLVIDERAVRTIGRWPWPREKMAQALVELKKYGVKTVAFDATFSEPQDRPELNLYEHLKQELKIEPNDQTRIEAWLESADHDRKLGTQLADMADQVVLGAFFQGELKAFNHFALPNLCHSLLFKKSEAYKTWNHEAILIGVLDDFQVQLPEALNGIYSEHLDEISNSIQAASPGPATAQERDQIQQKIHNAQISFCFDFLSPEKDIVIPAIEENWNLVQQSTNGEIAASFSDWLSQFSEKTLINQVAVADDWVMFLPELARTGPYRHTGFFNASQDSDGSIRRNRLVVRTGDFYMPSLGLKTYLLAKNYNANIHLSLDPRTQTEKLISKLIITDNETGAEVRALPVDGQGQLLINYAGGQQMFPYISFADILSPSADLWIEQRQLDPNSGTYRYYGEQKRVAVKKSEFLKDKILVIGATATGIYDLRVTPFEENFPGPETHVNVIDNLLRADFLANPSHEEPYMLLTLIVLGIVLTLTLSRLGAISGLVLTALTIVSILLVDKYVFFLNGHVIAVFFPLFLVGLLYVSLTFYKYLTEERNKKELRSTFSKYVSPAIVDEILEHPENIALGGRKANLTVFFSDVRGFTSISEKLPPEALSELLNRYLTPMTELVFEHKGTLDKYMGDAIMAFFGAPIAYPDHPEWACRCALAHIRALYTLQDEFKAQNLPIIDIGIGLNTGDCSVGNMGSKTVRSYTVMGDSVNLASRLEGITKQYGVKIIISEFTETHLPPSFVRREIDRVRVKGKNEPVRIFELIADGTPSATLLEFLDSFNKGYTTYQAAEFATAISCFQTAAQLNPNDLCSQIYIKRCQDYIDTPPTAGWDGVYTLTSK